MIEDCYYESQLGGTGGSELVDLAVGGSVGYLNLRGFYRPERAAKVARFAEIIDELRFAAVLN